METIGKITPSVMNIRPQSCPKNAGVTDGEYVSGQRAVPPVRAQRDRWETGKNPPNTKKNFGYLMWVNVTVSSCEVNDEAEYEISGALLMMLNGAVMASENVNTPETASS